MEKAAVWKAGTVIAFKNRRAEVILKSGYWRSSAMFIHEMSDVECRRVLKQHNYGRLACALENQPYVVPIHFAFDGKFVYVFTTFGQKIEWMRANPNICLEVDERTCHDKWMSIILFGRFEELPNEPRYKAARIEAHNLLQRFALWWEPAYIAAVHRDAPHSLIPVYFRIHVDRITGHRATPEHVEKSAEPKKGGWWRSAKQYLHLSGTRPDCKGGASRIAL